MADKKVRTGCRKTDENMSGEIFAMLKVNFITSCRY